MYSKQRRIERILKDHGIFLSVIAPCDYHVIALVVQAVGAACDYDVITPVIALHLTDLVCTFLL